MKRLRLLALLLTAALCFSACQATPDEQENITLTVSSEFRVGLMDDYAREQGIQLVSRDMAFFFASEIHQLLVQRSPDIDIYYVDGVFVDGKEIFDKAYAYPLPMDGLIGKTVQRMYPAVQEAVIRDGKLLALPLSNSVGELNLRVDLAVAQEAEALGWTRPTSYEAFLNSLADWPDALLDAGIVPGSFLQGKELVQQTLYQFLLYTEDVTQPDEELLGRLMNGTRAALQGVPKLANAAAGSEPRSVYSKWHPEFYTTHFIGHEYLPLPLLDGGEGRLGISLTFMFINPYSRHPKEATDYLTAMLEAMLQGDDGYEMKMLADASGTEERPEYRGNIESLTALLTQVEAQQKTEQDPATQRDLAMKADDLRKELAHQELNRYIVDEASLSRWQQQMRTARVVDWRCLHDTSVNQLIEQFTTSNMTGEHFAEQFLQIMKKMALEDA